MLNLRQVKHVAAAIGFHPDMLREIAANADAYCEEFVVIDPLKPCKERRVLNVTGALRTVQHRLLHKVFIPKLSPSPYAHGGVRSRHIKSNIEVHAESVFALTSDICNFYPTISHIRVYRLFVDRLGCTPDVANILTPLCTWRHHLALGLVTSPFLAEQVLVPIDRRIGAACAAANLRYSRFVDDITISGGFNLENSGFRATVNQILGQHGFDMHPDKTAGGRLADGMPITKIVIHRGHPDVRREYLEELNRQLDDAKSLAADGEFAGPYFAKSQIVGRVRFVCWIRRGRQRQLVSKMNSINWDAVAKQAATRGLVAAKKRLVRLDATAGSFLNLNDV